MAHILSITIDEPKELQTYAGHVVTVNPEMLVDAHRDRGLHAAIIQAEHRVADGFGVQLACWFTGQSAPSRQTGVALMKDLLVHAQRQGEKVYFLGATHSAQEMLSHVLKKQFPELLFTGDSAIQCNDNGEAQETAEVMQKINTYSPKYIFVAFGHGKQEKWIFKNKNNFPAGTVIVGVGGALDFVANQVRRAPCVMQKIGLEWLWRLVQEPRRFLRIVKAVAVFPVIALLHHYFKQHEK